MLFREDAGGTTAISQPMHAWISGQLMRALHGEHGEALYLAAEQHDIAWLDWEAEPTFDAVAGRPHLFRDIGALLHAPMWRRGVEHALAAWGPHLALLVSRHGGVIYRRFTMRHRGDPRDADAAAAYLVAQAPREARWAETLKLSPADLDYQSGLIAFVDNLSLALCGELKTPLELPLPVFGSAERRIAVTAKPDAPDEFTLSPWPFARERVAIEGEGRRLPAAGRFADEAAFRAWGETAPRTIFSARLSAP